MISKNFLKATCNFMLRVLLISINMENNNVYQLVEAVCRIAMPFIPKQLASSFFRLICKLRTDWEKKAYNMS